MLMKKSVSAGCPAPGISLVLRSDYDDRHPMDLIKQTLSNAGHPLPTPVLCHVLGESRQKIGRHLRSLLKQKELEIVTVKMVAYYRIRGVHHV